MGAKKEILGAWMAEWILLDGKIVCVSCGRRQPLSAAEDFTHAKNCAANTHPVPRPLGTLGR
ncbi:hypothetical protein [Pseudomonas abietaniphila]|uniref:hypothetical protein n=1 Tax=Pseudomonas abietaniphila TaxID=89065 RepID=UPI00115FF55D|nr:hypothetical protein [Pseudomonas abietaniphila]